MIELLSDQENEVDKREEAFGNRAVGKCRDYKPGQVRTAKTIQKEKKNAQAHLFQFQSPQRMPYQE